MNDDGKALYEATLRSHLQTRLSRAAALKAAVAGIAAAAAAPAVASADGITYAGGPGGAYVRLPYYPQVAGGYAPEPLADIINTAQTAEHLAVTFLTAGLRNAGKLGLSGLILEVVQAALVEEVTHIQFLDTLGARPLTDTFSVPDARMLSEYTTFFNTLEIAETLFTGAYMTAAREFAEVRLPLFAKVVSQIGSVEAEHRSLARAALALRGVAADIPPNNKAFETDLFVHVRDAGTVLGDLGFLGNGPIKAAYPGIAAALATAGAKAQAAVIQKRPNNAPRVLSLRAINGELP